MPGSKIHARTHTHRQTQKQVMEMWSAFAFLSAFLRVAQTPNQTCTEPRAQPRRPLLWSFCYSVCLRARLLWSGRSPTSWLACLFFIKMPLNSSAEKSGAAAGIFSLYFFFLIFSPFFQARSRRLFLLLFLVFLSSSVCFSVCILAFPFLVLHARPFLLPGLKTHWLFQRSGCSVFFTRSKAHESFLFTIRQASEWHCRGLEGPTVHFSSAQMIDDEKRGCFLGGLGGNGCSWTWMKIICVVSGQ